MRGLVVAPEHRSSPYDRKGKYPNPKSTDRHIVRALGAVYGPYTRICFLSTGETDIEHTAATSEAHGSCLGARDRAARFRFASDLRNLTPASPHIDRYQKSGKDAAEWLPDLNRCWFAVRVVEVRPTYELTIDRREAEVLEQSLRRCESAAMEAMVCHATEKQDLRPIKGSKDGALARYDDSGKGRIACTEARRHGIAPLRRDHRAYRYVRDGDSDEVVCE